MRAENKVVQYETAMDMGLRVPEYVLTSSVAAAVASVGQWFVAKPLGPGHFRDGQEGMAVFATVLGEGDITDEQLQVVPFLLQQPIVAKLHLRVVTVNDQAWVAALNAATAPFDWRRADVAHRSFEAADFPQVAQEAQQLAAVLSVGYSSQDWIIDLDGDAWFLDLNPGGQWLFLPHDVSSAVTAAIADWLTG